MQAQDTGSIEGALVLLALFMALFAWGAWLEQRRRKRDAALEDQYQRWLTTRHQLLRQGRHRLHRGPKDDAA